MQIKLLTSLKKPNTVEVIVKKWNMQKVKAQNEK